METGNRVGSTEISVSLDKLENTQSPFYSATSIIAVFRNMVQEIWFEKYGSGNMVREKRLTRRKVVDQKKGGFIP
jgi:hypothetical protein